MEFIDRKREMAFLQDAFNSKRSEFIIIYGKRRVGKTELVKQFFKDIPTFISWPTRHLKRSSFEVSPKRRGFSSVMKG